MKEEINKAVQGTNQAAQNVDVESTQEISLKSNRKQVKYENVILTSVLLFMYVGTLIYGIVEMINPTSTSESQATLIVLQCTGGLVLVFAPDILEKFFKVKLAFPIRFGIEFFGVLGIILGEGAQFYYKFSWWDDMLHFSSGVGAAFLGFSLLSNFLKKSETKHKVAICIIGSICISFSIGFFWEIMEFSMDYFFGTNMQKSIPEISALFNGGDTSANLLGTDEEIANFFRTPAGYRYALMDTMSDLIDCFIGTFVFEIIGFFITRKHKRAFENLIMFHCDKTGYSIN